MFVYTSVAKQYYFVNNLCFYRCGVMIYMLNKPLISVL